MLRIDELAFRIICGLIAEDVKWSQVSDYVIGVRDVSPTLAAMVAELRRRVLAFEKTGKIEVEDDLDFMFSHNEDGHPSPNIDAPNLGVYIEFERINGLCFGDFRGAGRVGARPSPGDESCGCSVMR